jgi:hypothetical protein
VTRITTSDDAFMRSGKLPVCEEDMRSTCVLTCFGACEVVRITR